VGGAPAWPGGSTVDPNRRPPPAVPVPAGAPRWVLRSGFRSGRGADIGRAATGWRPRSETGRRRPTTRSRRVDRPEGCADSQEATEATSHADIDTNSRNQVVRTADRRRSHAHGVRSDIAFRADIATRKRATDHQSENDSRMASQQVDPAGRHGRRGALRRMPTLPSVPWYRIAQPAARPSSRGAGAVALAQWIKRR